MRHGSLFSGIGGFDLAAEWMGWENVFHCEWNEFGQTRLKHYWPYATSYGDITKTDFTIHRGSIDILTGGDPCQPSSVAGKRKGKEDDRYLWPEYKRAIIEIQPGWILNENVPGSISNGILDEKINDLESLNYAWWPPVIIPASAVGAYHKRERVWLVAHLNSKRVEGSGEEQVFRKPNVPQRQVVYPFQDNEREFDTFESRLCRSLHRLPKGVDRVKSLGNAIVPQIAYEIFKTIEQYERHKEITSVTY